MMMVVVVVIATRANRGLKLDRSPPNCHNPGFSLVERARCCLAVNCAVSRLVSCPKCPDRTLGGRERLGSGGGDMCQKCTCDYVPAEFRV